LLTTGIENLNTIGYQNKLSACISGIVVRLKLARALSAIDPSYSQSYLAAAIPP